jgi:hypothetical protein
MADKDAERDEEPADGTFASPPCYMHEIDPAYAGLVVDPGQARDVARGDIIHKDGCLSVSDRERYFCPCVSRAWTRIVLAE